MAPRLISLLLPLCALVALPAQAHEADVQDWIQIPAITSADQYSVAARAVSGRAVYGPFQVLDERRVALVAATDSRSPQALAALLRDHPYVQTLEMIDCPGTYDDLANLTVGRMIRRAGLATHVPPGGSVRSGAVELFLAGVTLRVDDGAEFAVHSWEDGYGREATDFAANSPENRKYLNYYREMGMDEAEAAAFYAMTNSVPFERARWLDAHEMRRWLPPTHVAPVTRSVPRLAYLDLSAMFF